MYVQWRMKSIKAIANSFLSLSIGPRSGALVRQPGQAGDFDVAGPAPQASLAPQLLSQHQLDAKHAAANNKIKATILRRSRLDGRLWPFFSFPSA